MLRPTTQLPTITELAPSLNFESGDGRGNKPKQKQPAKVSGSGKSSQVKKTCYSRGNRLPRFPPSSSPRTEPSLKYSREAGVSAPRCWSEESNEPALRGAMSAAGRRRQRPARRAPGAALRP